MLAFVILFMLALAAVAGLFIAFKSRGNRRMAAQKAASGGEVEPKTARAPGLD